MKTHDVHGHEYTEENTVYRGKGSSRRRYCRICLSARFKRWYDKNKVSKIGKVAKWQKDNPERLRVRRKRSYHEKKLILIEEFGGKCRRCGYNEYAGALDFDHINKEDKKYGVLRGNRSLEAAREEAKKCQLLCANCHRIKTHAPELF